MLNCDVRLPAMIWTSYIRAICCIIDMQYWLIPQFLRDLVAIVVESDYYSRKCMWLAELFVSQNVLQVTSPTPLYERKCWLVLSETEKQNRKQQTLFAPKRIYLIKVWWVTHTRTHTRAGHEGVESIPLRFVASIEAFWCSWASVCLPHPRKSKVSGTPPRCVHSYRL